MRALRLAFEWRRPATAIVLSCIAGGALAEGPRDNYWGELEYFFPTISSTVRMDFPGTNVPGTKVSLEDDLDLSDRKGTPYLLLGMRVSQNWRLEFEYYQLNRSASVIIGRSIDFGDIHLNPSATVTTKFDTSIYRGLAEWSFYRSSQAEAGLALGLHVTQFSVQLSGQGNGPLGLGFQSEKKDATVPLPTLGLYGEYMLADQWILRGRVDYLSLNYEQYNGRLINYMTSVSWRFVKNWGVGVGYRYVDYRLTSDKTNFHGEVQYKFQGPTIYFEGGF